MIQRYEVVYSMDEAITVYEDQGGHWFTPGARRFFRSFWGSFNWETRTFVSSEQFDYTSPRLYSIRQFDAGFKSIDTISSFQEFDTRAQAIAAQKRHARQEVTA